MKGILLQPSGTDTKSSFEAKALLKSWGNSWIDTLQAGVIVPPGPYFYKDNALWQVLRLYDDYQGAFLALSDRRMKTESMVRIFLSSFLVAEVFCSTTTIASTLAHYFNSDETIHRLQTRFFRAVESGLFGVGGGF